MKNVKFYLTTLLLVGFIFMGCNKVKDILDITFDATYTTDININVQKSRNVKFSESATVDPSSDHDVKQYWDKIKKFEVNSVTAEITSISKDDVQLITSDLTISNESKTVKWTVNNIPLVVGTTITLDNSSGQWDTLSQILGDKKLFKVTVSGETSDGDFQFTIQVTIKSKVTANLLQ